MARYNKSLCIAAIVGTTFLFNACASNTSSGQNYHPKAGYGPVDVSDLYNSNAGYAKQQLRARGFAQVGEHLSGGFDNTWWLNSNTKQCFVLETANGKVMTLNSATLGNCHAPGGQQGSNNPNADLPQPARAACFNRFGEPGYQRIKMVSPLKPGYWEVIILGRNGRQVACTVDQYGGISDWVNM